VTPKRPRLPLRAAHAIDQFTVASAAAELRHISAQGVIDDRHGLIYTKNSDEALFPMALLGRTLQP